MKVKIDPRGYRILDQRSSSISQPNLVKHFDKCGYFIIVVEKENGFEWYGGIPIGPKNTPSAYRCGFERNYDKAFSLAKEACIQAWQAAYNKRFLIK